MSMLSRLVPTPLASAALFAMWLVLARHVTPGQILLGLIVALAAPHATRALQLRGVQVKRPVTVVRFILRVGRDVLVSNVEVAWGVVTWRWRRPKAAFVVIPLELRDPVALAALAMVTTVVPGTVWSELSLDRHAMLLHVWDLPDPDAFVRRFKARYEAPLREIFE